MTLISQSFPSLIGGVSQQAPSQRLLTQVELQENCLNSITQGMRKRPNTVLKAELDTGSDVLTDGYIHQVKRDKYEKYIMVIRQDGIQVYDRDTGFRYPVINEGNAVEYLKLINATDSERTAYHALTSADTTYILNRTQPVFRKNSFIPIDENTLRQRVVVSSFNYNRQVIRFPDSDPYNRTGYEEEEAPLGKYRILVDGQWVADFPETTSPSEVVAGMKAELEQMYPTYTFITTNNILYIDRPKDDPEVVFTDSSYIYRGIVEYEDNSVIWQTVPYSVMQVSDTDAPINALYDVEPALIHVRQADYSVSYTVVINGSRFTHTTPEATSERARAGLSLRSIMSSLAGKINTSGLPVTATVGNGYILVEADSEQDFTLSVEDDLNGQAIVGIHKSTQLFSDLPSKAPEGYLVKVVGSVESTDNGYWVKFVQTGDLGQGHWEETRAPDQPHELDADTMPHTLIREASQTYVTQLNPQGIHFKFKAAEWDVREVGDDDSTPFPSFVSEWDNENNIPIQLRYIHAMTFHKNRLVFSSDENVVFSESGNYWNFFRTTAQVVKDSDRIDINILSPVVNPILGMVSAQKELVLYGSRRQYSLKSGDIFSASTVWADSIASYDVDLAAQPQYVGNSVYFVVNREKFNGIFESQVLDEQHNAVDVTAHVPEYIEGRIRKIAPSGSEDVLLVLPDANVGEGSTVYQYSHKTQGTEKVHSAWNAWKFTQDILDITIEGSVAYMVTHHNGKYFSEVLNLSEDNVRDTLGIPVFLDMRQEIPTTDPTPEGMAEVVYKGRKFIGFPYVQRVVLSEIYLRDGSGQSIQTGRLQLRRLSLNFDETTSFDVSVKQEAREERVTRYEGRVLGSVVQRIGRIPVDNGTLKVPLFGRAKGMEVTIINDSPFDCRIQSGEWEGLYHNRARRS